MDLTLSTEVWLSLFAAAVNLVLSLWGAGHAALNKRDPRAALGWAMFCLLAPIVGATAYATFGVNRIRTQPERLALPHLPDEAPLPASPPPVGVQLQTFRNIGDRVTSRPVSTAHGIEILHNGDEAYPAMLRAIDGAQERVWLGTYIFDSDGPGLAFVNHLKAAMDRGVDVRVLVDGIGEFYSRPRISKVLDAAGVPVARFIPPRLLPPNFHINLRNHRKLMVVDRDLVFAGGMNIGQRHMRDEGGELNVQDIQFKLCGPITEQFAESFWEDWRFASNQAEDNPPDIACAPASGGVPCRAIVDGPDAHLDKLPLVIEGAISSAEHSIDIMTPYFLPARPLISALRSAALRGVTVRIILPEKNNLPFVHWATRHMLSELLKWDVAIYYQPAPFSHTKFLVIDGHYSLLGSANLDQRSLRLNFELGLELYSSDFGSRMLSHFNRVAEQSRLIELAELRARRLPTRLLDATAWLFSPYL